MLLDSVSFVSMAKELDAILGDPDQYMEIFKIKREEAENDIRLYTELKDKASLGDRSAKAYLVNQYSRLLMQKYNLTDNNITNYVDFHTIKNNSIEVLFEMLLDVYDLKQVLVNHFYTNENMEKQVEFPCIDDEMLLDVVIKEEVAIKEHFKELSTKVKLIASMIYSKEYGQDCIDTLQYHDINEIGIIDKDYIYIVFRGRKIHLKFLHFRNESIIMNIQKKTTQKSADNYDEQTPVLVTSKLNSSRITVAGFKSTPDSGSLYYNERIFNLDKINLEEMRDRYNTINDLMYDMIMINQTGRGSHFVTGSDMGVGKSTFMLAMMEKVPNIWGIGVLDKQDELQAKKKYPWKNVLTIIENEQVNLKNSFAIMLKMARDVLYVGEITQPDEVAELVNASLRLNSGVGATLHSLSPFETVVNLRNLMMRTDMYNDSDIAEADIARGVDLVVHLAKLDNGRIIVENIVEVVYIPQDHKMDPVLNGTLKDKIDNLMNMTQMAISKYLYSKYYVYNEIVRFDRDKNVWIPVNLPTDAYFSKVSKYVSKETINNFKEKFKLEQSKIK
ncbi:MAG: ATPase, T2SS/T4P/T4SS family [Clostridia bacterium]|jgi:pilus assembly protein CpaF|nr:ATPase, T2SS/T4P/T4SS family [Clostridia bacterium]